MTDGPLGAAKGQGCTPGSLSLAAARQLPVLVSLQQQLEAKLHNMVSEQQARQLLGVPPDAPCLLPDKDAAASCSSGPASRDALAGVLSRHGAMALAYVQGQRHILQMSLHDVRAQIRGIVCGMARYAAPDMLTGPNESGPGDLAVSANATFEVVRPAWPESPEHAALDASSLCRVPAVWDLSEPAHMNNFSQWLHALLAPRDDAAAAGSGRSIAGRCGIGLCEVLFRPRKEAIAAAAAARKAAVRASASGSRGKRKPLASVTLRSLRAIGSGNLAARASAATTAVPGQEQQAARQREAAQQQPAAPSLPAGVSASLGLDMTLAYDSMSWGAMTTANHKAEDILLEVPIECAVVAGSREELLQSLLIPAHTLLQELVAHAAGQRRSNDSSEVAAADAAGQAAAQLERLQPREMLVLHLMQLVGAPPASRLPASENDQVSMLLEMLEDSPAGSSCQEAFETLKADYQQLAKASGRPSPSCVPANGSHQKALRKVLTWPGAFGLYCWAGSVVERCAVRLHGSAAGGPSWAVLPVASAVPEGLRDAVLQVELVQGGPAAAAAAAAAGTVPGQWLQVRACCDLPQGLLLCPTMLLPYTNVEQLMSSYGPEALAWRSLLSRQQQQQQAKASSTIPTALAGTPFDPAAKDHEICRAAGPRVLYELYISPSEADPLYQEKLELLAAAGVGTVHYLTEGLETECLVLTALKICLADEELLMHPLVHQVMQLNQAMGMFKQQSCRAQPEAMHPTAMMAAAVGEPGSSSMTQAQQPGEGAQDDGSMPQGQGQGQGSDAAAPVVDAAASLGAGSSGGAVPRGFMHLVQQSQQMLVDMLESLPEDHEVCMAAMKQLRHIVHDARKHTQRRLRQMDTQEEQRTGGGSFWNGGSSAGMSGPQQQHQQQQQGLEVMRQGVHLYLEELVIVLDAWSQHLGLEPSKLEPACKRPKLRHRV